MRSIQIYTPSDTFDFGKYKGKTISEILTENESYIHWCIKNVGWFCVSEDVISQFITVKLSELLNDSQKPNLELRDINEIKLRSYENNKVEYSTNYDSYDIDNYYESFSRNNWLVDAAGCDDPEVMNDVYWNID